MERPFLIRNSRTGAEYEIKNLEVYERSPYAADPDWYIATGKHKRPIRRYSHPTPTPVVEVEESDGHSEDMDLEDYVNELTDDLRDD